MMLTCPPPVPQLLALKEIALGIANRIKGVELSLVGAGASSAAAAIDSAETRPASVIAAAAGLDGPRWASIAAPYQHPTSATSSDGIPVWAAAAGSSSIGGAPRSPERLAVVPLYSTSPEALASHLKKPRLSLDGDDVQVVGHSHRHLAGSRS